MTYLIPAYSFARHQINGLSLLIDGDLVAIEAGRDDLDSLLADVDRLVGKRNFTALAETLSTAEQEINNNGDVIVSKFVNDTADEVYDDVIRYSDDTVAAVENDIGKCRPVYDALTTVIDTSCVQAVSTITSLT